MHSHRVLTDTPEDLDDVASADLHGQSIFFDRESARPVTGNPAVTEKSFND